MTDYRAGVIVAAVAICAGAWPTMADTTSDSVLSQTRLQVMALRVTGTPRVPFSKPIFGTGFLVGTALGDRSKKFRIITAAHVVRRDEDWERMSFGVDRGVFPFAEGVGPGIAEIGGPFGYNGVSVHQETDIAEVAIAETRDRKPIKIEYEELLPSRRYFVVSWGDAHNARVRQTEPYIREVKYLGKSDEKGQISFQILDGQQHGEFKQSESGSPVFNERGGAVALLVASKSDNRAGTARIGNALAFRDVKGWLDRVRRDPVLEPTTVSFVSITQDVSTVERAIAFDLARDGCIFLGKYSARNRTASENKFDPDAPFGAQYLTTVIGRFDSSDPGQIPDDRASNLLTDLQDIISVKSGGEVNFRRGCPTPLPKLGRVSSFERGAFYGPVVATLRSTYKIRLKTIVRLAYLEDFFFWGVVENVYRE